MLAVSEAFETWRDQSREQKRIKFVCSKVINRLCYMALWRAFDRWMCNTVELSREEGVCTRVMARFVNSLLARVFSRWRYDAAENKRLVEVCVRVADRISSLATWRAFNTWRSNVDVMISSRDLAARVVKRLGHMLSWRAFDRWKSIPLARTNVMSKATVLLGRFLHRNISMCFVTWVEEMRMRRIVARVLSRMRKMCCWRAFDAWEHAAKRQSIVTASAMKMITKMIKLPALRCIHSWLEYALRQRALRRVITRIRLASCHAAICGWADAIAERNNMFARARAVMGRWHTRTAGSAFYLWRTHSIREVEIRTAATSVVSRMAKLPLLKSLHTWREQTRMARIVQRAIRKMQTGSSWHALISWKYHSQEQKRQRFVCTKIVKRMMMLAVSEAFECCRDHSREQKKYETVCYRIVKRMMMLAVSEAFE